MNLKKLKEISDSLNITQAMELIMHMLQKQLGSYANSEGAAVVVSQLRNFGIIPEDEDQHLEFEQEPENDCDCPWCRLEVLMIEAGYTQEAAEFFAAFGRAAQDKFFHKGANQANDDEMISEMEKYFPEQAQFAHEMVRLAVQSDSMHISIFSRMEREVKETIAAKMDAGKEAALKDLLSQKDKAHGLSDKEPDSPTEK